MAKPAREQDLLAIEAVLRRHPEGAGLQRIAADLDAELAPRTLQHRLKHLVDRGRLVRRGRGRWTLYAIAAEKEATADESEANLPLPLSKGAREIRRSVLRAVTARKPVGYDRSLLDAYRPNKTFYLSEAVRKRLAEVGRPKIGEQPAGTYARQILNRLLVDLSWNSSRLEGNTYSLLDTRRLIEFGQAPKGKQQLEAQMILNHKDAIEFLVVSAEEVGFNRYSILNLHALLANNLLADPSAAGRLRRIAVGIEGSVFYPLELPQLIEECFEQLLATAEAINDPYEQAFFFMVHLPYLQPFDDVNKRVSRLGANIPLIRNNLVPLAFTDVPRSTYTQAVLGIYELRRVDLLRDIFVWAYDRSVARYAAVRQSLGEPDPFRLRHREGLRGVICDIIRGRMGRKAALEHLASWTARNIGAPESRQFQEVAENELLGLHEGNFARYQIRPSEFAEWQSVWNKAT